MEDTPLENGEFKLLTAGDKLREARKAAGMDMEAVAAKTRVPIRHLEAIEESRFDDLPGRTYAMGFAKAYAGAVGLSEEEFVDDLRAEIEEAGMGSAARETDAVQYAAEDPSKVPSARTAWIIAIIGVALLIGGYALWRTTYFPGTSGEESEVAQNATQDQAASETVENSADNSDSRGDQNTATPPSASGEVVFTATEENVWVKFYDGAGEQLLQKQMALGERFVVPVDADNPQIWTGRPDAFSITIGGQAVPPLGTAERSIKDVPISATALLARNNSDDENNAQP